MTQVVPITHTLYPLMSYCEIYGVLLSAHLSDSAEDDFNIKPFRISDNKRSMMHSPSGLLLFLPSEESAFPEEDRFMPAINKTV